MNDEKDKDMTSIPPSEECTCQRPRLEDIRWQLADYFTNCCRHLNTFEDENGAFQFALKSGLSEIRVILSPKDSGDRIVICGKAIAPLTVEPANWQLLTEFAVYVNEFLSVPDFTVREDGGLELSIDGLVSGAHIEDIVSELVVEMFTTLGLLLPGFQDVARGSVSPQESLMQFQSST
jgi:hypothetical protein